MLTWECPECSIENTLSHSSCFNCGFVYQSIDGKSVLIQPGEHKVVTVIFTDLSNYSSLSENLDSEQLQEIMDEIFKSIQSITTKYEGHIDEILGDGAKILFGLHKTNEDDAVRAVKAALEIHSRVEKLNCGLENNISKLTMHTGINSGSVAVDSTHLYSRLLGDTINIASRLSETANPGEIIIGNETFNLANRFFNFESIGELKLKGRACHENAYKVMGIKDEPEAVRHLAGRKADFTDHIEELSRLLTTLEHFKRGQSQIVVIKGDAGIGKSRLVEEFIKSVNLDNFQWLVGHSYPYSKNIAYFTFIDLISRAWRINEDDSPQILRNKIESNLDLLLRKSHNFSPYIGSLYGLNYEEIDEIGPDYWKENLFKAIKAIFLAFTRKTPTTIYFEDVHWMDPSSVELIKYILNEKTLWANFIFICRSSYSFFSSEELKKLPFNYQEIEMNSLSSTEAELMIESLLDVRNLPLNLRSFINDKVGGNPFYIEQITNSLIEKKILIRENGGWKLTDNLDTILVPISVKEIILSRLDQLDNETKQTMQEASVIGRVFNHQLLMKITKNPTHLDTALKELQEHNLVDIRSVKPDVEYAFKHLLIQEVAYSSILKKDRKQIHEKIGLAIESLFADRIYEFLEMLAIHFKNGTSIDKSIDYLIKAGEKSLKRYSVEESHQYFSEAYNLLVASPGSSDEKNLKIAELLIKWSMCFYYRAAFLDMENFLKTQEDILISLGDKKKLGMLYVWIGTALNHREKYEEAYEYLNKALRISKETEDKRIASYAYVWIAIVSCELGLIDDAMKYIEKGGEFTRLINFDPFIQHMVLNVGGYIYWARGDKQKTIEYGQELLRFGHNHKDNRSLVNGHWILGLSNLIDGKQDDAIACFKKAMEVSIDPWLSQLPKLNLAMSYLTLGKHREAEEYFNEIIAFSNEYGMEVLGNPAKGLLGVVYMAKGSLNEGMKMFQDYREHCLLNNIKWRFLLSEYILASVYLDIYEGNSKPNFKVIYKNLSFIVRHAILASHKAQIHLNNAIKEAKVLGTYGLLGELYLNLGILQNKRGKKSYARDSLLDAIKYFEKSGANNYVKVTNRQLENLALK